MQTFESHRGQVVAWRRFNLDEVREVLEATMEREVSTIVQSKQDTFKRRGVGFVNRQGFQLRQEWGEGAIESNAWSELDQRQMTQGGKPGLGKRFLNRPLA